MASNDKKTENLATHTLMVSTLGFTPLGANARPGDSIQFTSTETVATMSISFDTGLFSCSNPFTVGPLSSVSHLIASSEGDFAIHASKDELRDPSLPFGAQGDAMTGSIKVGGGTDS